MQNHKTFSLIIFFALSLLSCARSNEELNTKGEIDFIKEDEKPVSKAPIKEPIESESVNDSLPHAEHLKATSSCEGSLSTLEFEYYSDLLERFGLIPILPDESYVQSLEGLQQYFNDSNFTSIDLDKLTLPGQPDQFNECKDDKDSYIKKYPNRKLFGTHLIPPRSCWMRMIAVLKLVKIISHGAGISNYKITSYYRPKCYNDKVGGAPSSDHIDAQAIDVNFFSAAQRMKAQKFYCQNYWKPHFYEESFVGEGKSTGLNLATGLGANIIHFSLGARSIRGAWAYQSYLSDKKHQSHDCWKWNMNNSSIFRDGFFE